MALNESESMEYDDIKSEFQLQQPLQEESMKVDPNNAASFNKQNSILSLTLDEIQLKSGKSFGSMNMDEFLANLWNVDENQVPQQPAQNEPTNYANIGVANQAATLQQQQQASLSVPATLCKKTVDEVWFEIQKEHNPNNVCRVRGPPQCGQTYGEMTLEEFLVQAGIVQYAPPMSAHRGMLTTSQSNNKNTTTSCLDANFQMGHVMGIGFSAHPSLNGFVTYQTFSQNNTLGGESSNNGVNEYNLVDSNGQKNKRRIIDGPPEIVVERRQRRMIKNRESAARSRARKQAYTVELELELNLLKEENAKLKQIVEEIEQKRKQEVMNKKKTTMAQKKASKLRTMRRSLSLSL